MPHEVKWLAFIGAPAPTMESCDHSRREYKKQQED